MGLSNVCQIHDDPSNEQLAKNALKMIAEYRRSPVLLSHLENQGEYQDYQQMDIGQAYAYFGIQDRTINDDVLTQVYTLRV